eukprot:COSAG02_NODE_43827_length_371_cov_0.944853_1_plen_72_part_01
MKGCVPAKNTSATRQTFCRRVPAAGMPVATARSASSAAGVISGTVLGSRSSEEFSGTDNSPVVKVSWPGMAS